MSWCRSMELVVVEGTRVLFMPIIDDDSRRLEWRWFLLRVDKFRSTLGNIFLCHFKNVQKRSLRNQSSTFINSKKMSSDTIPFFDSLSSIYDSIVLGDQTRRYQSLYDQFVSLYNTAPSHIVRAPGRVNLIVSPDHTKFANSRVNISITRISLSCQWQSLLIFCLPSLSMKKTRLIKYHFKIQILDFQNEKFKSTQIIPVRQSK